MFLSLFWLLLATAQAGSISAPGLIAGPDSGAATADPAAVHYNPAAIAGGDKRFDSMIDMQLAKIHVDATTTRNGGIDPNTNEPYNEATADVWVPVFLAGATFKVIPKRLTLGFAISDTYVGGGDYSGSEDDPPPYTSHQRYAGITVKIITISFMPAASVTIVDGLHVGAGAHYVMDKINLKQASDPLGSEGMGVIFTEGPYVMDTILSGSGTGGHFGWNSGIYFDRFKFLRMGVSFAGPQKWHIKGTSNVDGVSLSEPIDGNLEMSMRLPAVLRAYVSSEPIEMVEFGAGIEYQMWGMCCGGEEGDIVIDLTDDNGDPLEVEMGPMSVKVSTPQYSPRRLQNSMNIQAHVSVKPTKNLFIGTKLAYNTNAVPDFAVSATNLDYKSVGGMLAVRYKFGPVTAGLGYSKFFTFEREITNSAWMADKDSDDYVDERFTPNTPPVKAGTNGSYKAQVDIIGVRLGAAF
jgi:long-subunit fatty acid transport protein